MRMALGIHESAGGVWIDGPVFPSQFKKHQFSLVVQLNAEPVPARLIAPELLAKPLVVHPRRALHPMGLSSGFERSGHAQSGKGHVVRCSSFPLSLLAHAVLPLDHEWLQRRQFQVKTEMLCDGIERLRLAFPLSSPVPVPDSLLFKARSRNTRSAPVQALLVIEAFALRIRQGRMRQIQIIHRPRRLAERAGRAVFAVLFTLPEENQFEAEPFTPLIRHITRVIPPFRAEVFVLKVISGKLVPIAGQSLPVSKIRRRIRLCPGQHKQPKWGQTQTPEYSFHPVTMS